MIVNKRKKVRLESLRYQLELLEELSEDLIVVTERSKINEIKMDIVYEEMLLIKSFLNQIGNEILKEMPAITRLIEDESEAQPP